MDLGINNLPMDIVECILSFLTIPTICRMRVVCKEWNKVTNSAPFHALCEKNKKNEHYVLLWRKDYFVVGRHRIVLPRSRATFHFLDLDMERWYAIPSTQLQRTCAGCGPNEEKGQCFPPPRFDDIDPSFVVAVDQITHSYKVFFFNTLRDMPSVDMPLAYVLDSSIQQWRPVGGLPRTINSVIAFQNTIFATLNKGVRFGECIQLRLFRYQVEGDTFAKVWELNFRRAVVYSKLVVRHNRLFVLVITRLRKSLAFLHFPHLLSDPAPDEACFQTCQDAEGSLFEMYEILLDEGSAKPVVQFTEDALHAIWGGDTCSNFWFAFPCLDSKGGYSSVVMMHHHSGEMRRFHLATGAVDALPACTLSTTIPRMHNVTSTFDAKIMPLSLRDVLKHAPPTV